MRNVVVAVAAILCALGECAEDNACEERPILSLDAPVNKWHDALPLGNGFAGALVWGGGDTLNITLDRADFWHNVPNPSYDDPDFTWSKLADTVASGNAAARARIFEKKAKTGSATKLPGVRLVMKLAEGQKVVRFRLYDKTGVATATVSTAAGEKEIVAWFDDGDDLLSLIVSDGVKFVSRDFANNKSFDRLGGYPDPVVEEKSDSLVYRRARRKGAGNRFDRDFVAGVRFREASVLPGSKYWRSFHAESVVSVPDAEIQRFYDLAMYLYGAGARRGGEPLALQGLWTADNGGLPPWNGDYHNDMNLQMTYWAAGPAGHVEALDALMDWLAARLPEYRRHCAKVTGGKGAVMPGVMGLDGLYLPGWAPYHFHPINGIWAFVAACDAWEYEPSRQKAEKLLGFGRELADGFAHLLTCRDGVNRLHVSCSPEIGNNGPRAFLTPNSSYDRAIAMSFYIALARMADSLGLVDEAAKWRGLAGSFGPPNVTKDGVLELAKGRPLAESHRHPSHLMQVFPLVSVPLDLGVDFAKSVDQWESWAQASGLAFPSRGPPVSRRGSDAATAQFSISRTLLGHSRQDAGST